MDQFIANKRLLLEDLMETTENMLAAGRINEYQYIQSMNQIKTLHEFYTSQFYLQEVAPVAYVAYVSQVTKKD